MTEKAFLRGAKELEPRLKELRRHLHSHPGTGFAVEETVAFVEKTLEEIGVTSQRCGKAGVSALIGSGGPVFLLRADMDALPIREEASVLFAAQNGNMHACGHDMHTAMLLGAAVLLKAYEAELAGTVKLMFQPAEEILRGAKDMITAGILENPKVDAALMLHVIVGTPVPTGKLVVCGGGVSAPGAEMFRVFVQGRGTHGAMPHMGVDALQTAAQILIALQEIHARELPMGERAALTIGSFQAGEMPNVIPDTAELRGSLRAYREETQHLLKTRLEQITHHVASAFRGKAEVEFTDSCPGLLNDAGLSEAVGRYLKDLLGEKNVILSNAFQADKEESGSRPAGSEDFAYVSQQIPSLMVALSAGSRQDGYAHPLHHPAVCFDESALSIGAAAYAWTAMRWLKEHS